MIVPDFSQSTLEDVIAAANEGDQFGFDELSKRALGEQPKAIAAQALLAIENNPELHKYYLLIAQPN